MQVIYRSHIELLSAFDIVYSVKHTIRSPYYSSSHSNFRPKHGRGTARSLHVAPTGNHRTGPVRPNIQSQSFVLTEKERRTRG